MKHKFNLIVHTKYQQSQKNQGLAIGCVSITPQFNQIQLWSVQNPMSRDQFETPLVKMLLFNLGDVTYETSGAQWNFTSQSFIETSGAFSPVGFGVLTLAKKKSSTVNLGKPLGPLRKVKLLVGCRG